MKNCQPIGGSSKGELLVNNVVCNPFLRDLFLDKNNPRAVRTQTETTIERFSAEELSTGASSLIEAIDQDTNTNTIEAAKTRTAALTLLDPVVEFGVQKRVKAAVYKIPLVKAYRKEKNKLVSMINNGKQGNRQGIYDDIRALSKAEEIIKGHLYPNDREKLTKVLKLLKHKIWTVMTYEERRKRAEEFQNQGYNEKEAARELGISKFTFLWYANMK